jgi:putative transposase
MHAALQWTDAGAACGPHKTLYNRFNRWSRLGLFNRIFRALWRRAEAGADHDRRHPSESHRTAATPIATKW